MKKSIKYALMLGVLAIVPTVGARAEPNTCAGWVALCEAQCPSAMLINPNIPVGCTCESRYQTCKATKVWPDWRPGAVGHPVKG